MDREDSEPGRRKSWLGRAIQAVSHVPKSWGGKRRTRMCAGKLHHHQDCNLFPSNQPFRPKQSSTEFLWNLTSAPKVHVREPRTRFNQDGFGKAGSRGGEHLLKQIPRHTMRLWQWALYGVQLLDQRKKISSLERYPICMENQCLTEAELQINGRGRRTESVAGP